MTKPKKKTSERGRGQTSDETTRTSTWPLLSPNITPHPQQQQQSSGSNHEHRENTNGRKKGEKEKREGEGRGIALDK
jgi:hypothetical protein